MAGDSVIRAPAGESEIVITTTSRVAGAIHSLNWGGKEFIDSADHGRQLQSALNADLGTRYTNETFNPTEAGSRADGTGQRSSSQLLHLITTKTSLQSTTRMAFWLAPGERSGGEPAKNEEVLSNHLLTKRVTLGWHGKPHVIQYNVIFSLPIGERHHYVQFEAVTGYMPADFSQFWAFDPTTNDLKSLSDGPGEQPSPVVFATPDGQHAMGVFSPDQPSEGYAAAGYGRWRFAAERVVKWNCVFRLRDTNCGVEAKEYSFRNFVVVGDRKIVREALAALHAAHLQ